MEGAFARKRNPGADAVKGTGRGRPGYTGEGGRVTHREPAEGGRATPAWPGYTAGVQV